MYLYDDDELNCTHTLIGSYDLLVLTYDLLVHTYDLLVHTYDLLVLTYDLLVLTYDLLEDRGINDITINIFFIFDHIKQI